MEAREENSKAAAELDALQKEYWERQLREYPELSTWTGDNRYNDRFTDLSWNAFERRWADERDMLRRVQQINRTKLSGQDALSHALLVWELELAVAAQRFPPVMLLTQISGPQLIFPQLVSVTPFRTPDDYRSYLGRLAAFPRYLDQVTDLLGRGIETGWVQPAEPLNGIPAQIDGQLVEDIGQNALYAPLKEIPRAFPETERKELQSQARSLIARAVYPALKNFRDFITRTYLPAGSAGPIGATSLPGGAAYYAHCIREYTTTGLSAEQIHGTGLAEVARIRELMEAVIRQTGFTGSLHEFAAFLRTDPRFYFTNGEDLVTAYRDIAKRADAELPGLFTELPRTPYGVRPFPDYEAPSQTTAMYYPGAAAGSRAG
jgi:uncharacterized protein (DUF885 family)